MPSQVNDRAFKEKFRDEIIPCEGRRIIVTGGTTGLGRATVMLLAARGARVLTFGRHQQELDEAMADFKAVGGGEVIGLTADVTDPYDINRVFAEADKQLGGLDAVVCNAGMAADSVMTSDYPVWLEAVQTNLLGYMACCRAAGERMRPKKDGHIVCVGSLSAKARGAESDVYVATKSGVRGFSDALAKLLNKDGIRISIVEPGLVGSDMTTEKVSESQQDQKEQAGELLRAEEIAHAVVYCLEQPARCNVAMLQIRPTKQSI